MPSITILKNVKKSFNSLNLHMLGNFSCFCCHLLTYFKIYLFKNSFRNTRTIRIRVVSAVGRFGLGRFGQILGVSRFGLFWWVVSAVSRFGCGSFRPGGVLSTFLHT